MPSSEDPNKIGVISDTHGLLRSAVEKAFKGVELIVHAGDVGKPEVLKALNKIAPVVAVRGNSDWGEWAKTLPAQEIVEIGEVLLYVIHDVHDIDLNPSAAGIRIVISGHSHAPSVVERNGVLFLNPGSAGLRRFKLPVSLALVNIKGTKVDVELIDLEG
ncbi:MAG: metallophosphoesterase family protein [Desulfoferrobacter sp.]